MHCEEAFKVSDGRTLDAVEALGSYLEKLKKWDEARALRRQWKYVLDPPEIAGWIEEIDARGQAQREVTDGTIDHQSSWPMEQDLDDQYGEEV